MTIAPDETATIYTSGSWIQTALDNFKAYHCGSEDDDINVASENLNIRMAGVQVHMD
jgi:hypothetical protein